MFDQNHVSVLLLKRGYLTEDLPGLSLVEQADDDPGVLSLGGETERGKSHDLGELKINRSPPQSSAAGHSDSLIVGSANLAH